MVVNANSGRSDLQETGQPARFLDGKIAIVTGAGNGVGRAEAIELARHGALVVVNDNGSRLSGEGSNQEVALRVVKEIKNNGGEAVGDYEDVASWAGAKRLVEHAIAEFGGLDVLVNNAGNYRPKDLLDHTEEDWDSVLRVHLKGHFATTFHAGQYWKQEAQGGRSRRASIVNTTSRGALPPHTRTSANYAAAKAGIAALTVVSHFQLEQFGVRVNAIAPSGYTRMLAAATGAAAESADRDYPEFDRGDPANNAPLVAWLASDDSLAVGGQVFRTRGSTIQLMVPWQEGPVARTEGRWDAAGIGDAVYSQIYGSRPRRTDFIASVAFGLIPDDSRSS
jgi:NAD(P)-dependent dehydrogenase (short-subunit alcohol dehydrogenase family)